MGDEDAGAPARGLYPLRLPLTASLSLAGDSFQEHDRMVACCSELAPPSPAYRSPRQLRRATACLISTEPPTSRFRIPRDHCAAGSHERAEGDQRRPRETSHRKLHGLREQNRTIRVVEDRQGGVSVSLSTPNSIQSFKAHESHTVGYEDDLTMSALPLVSFKPTKAQFTFVCLGLSAKQRKVA